MEHAVSSQHRVQRALLLAVAPLAMLSSVPTAGAIIVDTDALVRRMPEAVRLSLIGFGRRPPATISGFATKISRMRSFTAAILDPAQPPHAKADAAGADIAGFFPVGWA